MFAGLISELVTKADLVDGATVMERPAGPSRPTSSPASTSPPRSRRRAECDGSCVAPAHRRTSRPLRREDRAPRRADPAVRSRLLRNALDRSGQVPPSGICPPIGEGEFLVLAPGALYAGYESGLARTPVAGMRLRRGPATGVALRGAWTPCWPPAVPAFRRRPVPGVGSRGPPRSRGPLAHGLGFGAEPPLIGLGRGTAPRSTKEWCSASNPGWRRKASEDSWSAPPSHRQRRPRRRSRDTGGRHDRPPNDFQPCRIGRL